MVTICEEITTESLVIFYIFEVMMSVQTFICFKSSRLSVPYHLLPPQAISDEAAKVIYQMKRATSTREKNSDTTQVQKKVLRNKDKTFMEAI